MKNFFNELDKIESAISNNKMQKTLDNYKLKIITNHWNDLGLVFTETGTKKILKLIRKFSLLEILNAIDISASEYLEREGDTFNEESIEKTFNKIGGIIITQRESEIDPEIKELYYIRGILRNRLYYCNNNLAILWLKAARSWGATIYELRDIALTTKNWSSFSDDIDEIIEKYKTLINTNKN